MFEYDSSDQSECEVAVALTTPITPCPPSASNNGDIEYVGSRKGRRHFLVIDHSANQRSGSKISKIWDYGSERRRLDDSTMSLPKRRSHQTETDYPTKSSRRASA
jgi:hypothetical protein